MRRHVLHVVACPRSPADNHRVIIRRSSWQEAANTRSKISLLRTGQAGTISGKAFRCPMTGPCWRSVRTGTTATPVRCTCSLNPATSGHRRPSSPHRTQRPTSTSDSAYRVSGDGSTIVTQSAGLASMGAVYVYVRPGGGWSNMTQTARLTASDGAGNDNLGVSVSVSADGSIVAAGAYLATVAGKANAEGHVCVCPSLRWMGQTGPRRRSSSVQPIILMTTWGAA